ncbi:MAG: hypothetical protein GX833_07600 [Clostridium sp.]|jgi:cell division protein FtsA|nr:hypothetical protein [Clostridium sp.]
MSVDQFITGLDLGSYYIKASAITGRNGDIIFSAYGESQGIEDGVVTDSVRLLAAIRSVLRKLEIKTGVPVQKAFLSIDTAYTRQESSRGSAGLSKGSVSEKDMLNAIKSSMRIARTTEEQICDVLIDDYKVDGIVYANPISVEGSLIDVSSQTILADKSLIGGQTRVLENERIQVLGTGLSVHGMANLLLTRSQRYNGALLIDSGHRKTDVVVLKNNRIVYSETIPLGGRNITKDLSIVLKISMNEAETLKKEFGAGELSPSHPKYDLISQVVEARAEEILDLANKAFKNYGQWSEIEQALVYGGGLCGFRTIASFKEDVFGISTNYMTSDIIKSDDIFSLNATGVAHNMIHELQSVLIAELWEQPKEAEEEVEIGGNYFSVLDKVRQKASKSMKEIIQLDEDDEDDRRGQSRKSHDDFRQKASENSIKSKLKKIFGIE